MGEAKRFNWKAEEDCLSVSLDYFDVRVSFPIVNLDDPYKLEAFQGERTKIAYDFVSLGEAMYFTEKSISKCKTVKDVIDEYRVHFIDNEIETKEVQDDDIEETDVYVLRSRRTSRL